MFPGLSGARRVEEKLYVEDVFSPFIYTGTGAAQSIVNGIDLAGEGGLVWIKGRSVAANHALFDTERGEGRALRTDSTNAQTSQLATTHDLTSFNEDGFSIGLNGNTSVNANTHTYVGWTFRKAKKFFDVVTYTGNGTNRAIAHNLGLAPGLIIIKNVTGASSWIVYHRAISNTGYLTLNTTNVVTTAATMWNSLSTTDTEFSLGSANGVNQVGQTFVAYLFAHDDGDDGLIQCGSFTTDGSGNATVSLGWEPQFTICKTISTTGDWLMEDTARSWDLGSATDKELNANTTTAETSQTRGNPTATGFIHVGLPSTTYAYLAIRKGLMRPPTDATKVFDIVARTGTGVNGVVSTSLTIKQGVDLDITKKRSGSPLNGSGWYDRLRGPTSQLYSSDTGAEGTLTSVLTAFGMAGVTFGNNTTVNSAVQDYINYFFKQARGFFDIVGYTGTGAAHTEAHNLGAVPELMIVKRRSGAEDWTVYYGYPTRRLMLNASVVYGVHSAYWNDTAPTSSVFTVGQADAVNLSGSTYIAYLFASCPGVSKIGTYVGTNAAQNIDCGFAAGARFVMIKRIDSTGDWFFFDTTRGIASGNDPYMLLNSTTAEAGSTDYIDPYSAGFELSSAAPTALNGSGRTFLYFAIA